MVAPLGTPDLLVSAAGGLYPAELRAHLGEFWSCSILARDFPGRKAVSLRACAHSHFRFGVGQRAFEEAGGDGAEEEAAYVSHVGYTAAGLHVGYGADLAEELD